MSEDPEERRRRDLQDLEFYRRRLRPTIADLWRTIENSGDNKIVIAKTSRTKAHNSEKKPPKLRPPLMRGIWGHDAEDGLMGALKASPTAIQTDQSDVAGPLAAVLIVLFVLGAFGMTAKVPFAIPL